MRVIKVKLNDLADVKVLIRIAMSQVSRRKTALMLQTAFFAAIRLATDIQDRMDAEDRQRIETIQDNLPSYDAESEAPNPLTGDVVAWIQRRYPQYALANDIGSGILDIIEQRKLWRELGFQTHDDWYRELENDAYIGPGIQASGEWRVE